MKQLTVLDENNDTSFTFYNNSQGIILREFEGFEYPSVREAIEEIAGPQSGVYVTSKFGTRRFSWSGDLLGDEVFELRRQMLIPLRQTGNLKTIKFTTYDDLALQCEAEIVKVINPYNHKIHSFLIEAIAPDWRFYSQVLKVLSSALDNQTVENEGNEITNPIIRIHGAGTEFVVSNSDTGEEFTITETLGTGDYIDVDTLNRTIIKNGDTSIFSSFAGEFIGLIPGVNNLIFSPVGDDANTLLTVTFRDAYNGI